ncbi:uncharacterized protein LOC123685461 isoform X3 [Harmonia axyridis]|uniref:uncharacterized protein LOC123685461 isoform X3 n=1 Tax=Harmonia axyridis TaxID=115357 RepID=UPI001E2795DA|nr:uncharacterized protein LOC123685461 isoform X3 [Harmonia axyridis]
MNHRALALKALYYDFNKITSLRCIFGSNMNFSVSKLSLRNCILRDQDCNFLKNCRYLEELDIENREDGVLKSNDANYQDNSEEELSEDSEDWDKELELEQITLSDDEWNGEAPSLPHIPINFYEKPSIYNDDVIFCDAD